MKKYTRLYQCHTCKGFGTVFTPSGIRYICPNCNGKRIIVERVLVIQNERGFQ